jgi:hypothetical protein
MDRPNDRLNNFIARSGAGFDAAGRTVYSGPGMMYMGPGEFAATRAVHSGLEADASKNDPQGQMIRQLLEQLARKEGRSTFQFTPPQQPAQGNQTYGYTEDNRRG